MGHGRGSALPCVCCTSVYFARAPYSLLSGFVRVAFRRTNMSRERFVSLPRPRTTLQVVAIVNLHYLSLSARFNPRLAWTGMARPGSASTLRERDPAAPYGRVYARYYCIKPTEFPPTKPHDPFSHASSDGGGGRKTKDERKKQHNNECLKSTSAKNAIAPPTDGAMPM